MKSEESISEIDAAAILKKNGYQLMEVVSEPPPMQQRFAVIIGERRLRNTAVALNLDNCFPSTVVVWL